MYNILEVTSGLGYIGTFQQNGETLILPIQ